MLQGYGNKPDANAGAFIQRGGRRFLRTGDLGCREVEGYFFAVDRLKQMINVGGFKVWPAEVANDGGALAAAQFETDVGNDNVRPVGHREVIDSEQGNRPVAGPRADSLPIAAARSSSRPAWPGRRSVGCSTR